MKEFIKKHKVFRNIIFYLKTMLFILVIVVLFRIFIFSSFSISSDSMYPTIIKGDHLVVNKLILGARIFAKSGNTNNTHTLRLKGLRPLKRNDVIVFNFPFKENTVKMRIDYNSFYVKRCIGLPGDTLFIDNGYYKVKGIDKLLGNYHNQSKLFFTSDQEVHKITNSFDVFPNDSIHYNWNIKHFGPLYIPKKKETIKIDPLNIILYRSIIEHETGKHIKTIGDKIYLDSLTIDEYHFTDNYYFVAGDNILNSEDSRYWGILPEIAIIGVVTHILKSNDPITKEFRTDRFLKKIE